MRWSEQLSDRPGPARQVPHRAAACGSTTAPGFDLTEAGTRKRLAVHVVEDPADVPQIATLGRRAALATEFTPERLAELLAARNQQVKGLLRDQGTIAGIGNAYSDEILLVARMSPFAMTRSFDDAKTATLYARDPRRAHRGRRGRRRASPPPSSRTPSARACACTDGPGEPCPGWDGIPCGDTVHEVSFADSALQYCPTCQTGGKPLADRRMSRAACA